MTVPYNLRRFAFQLASVAALSLAILTLSLANATGASGDKDPSPCPCINVANGVMAEEDDGIANDALFWAHLGETGIVNITIEVYYDNGTLYAKAKTVSGAGDTENDDGEVRFYNLTAGKYSWKAFDIHNRHIKPEGGTFVITSDSTLEYLAAVIDIHEDGKSDDFIAGANLTQGGNASKWVEIFAGGGQLLAKGWMVEADFGDDGPSHAFIEENLSRGRYSYEIWSDDDHTTFYQDGNFSICKPHDCINVDMQVTAMDGREYNDALFIAHIGDFDNGVGGLTIHLYYDNGTPIGNITTDSDGLAMFTNLSDGGYRWNVTRPNGKSLEEGYWFVINSRSGYEHAAYVVDTYEQEGSWQDDFVFFLNVSGDPQNDAYVEVYDAAKNLIAKGNTSILHEGTYYFLADNLSVGRYYFKAWRNDTTQELIQNGTFVVCPPLHPPGPPVYFSGKWWWSEENGGDEDWSGTIFIQGYIATDLRQEQSGWIQFEVYNATGDLLQLDTLDYNVTDEDEWFMDWNWTTNESGSYLVLVYIFNDNEEQLHQQQHWFCLGEGCYQPLVWFSWKESWSYDSDEDGWDDTLHINGTLATDLEEWVTGYLNFTVYGPDDFNETQTYSFRVNATNWQDFEWEWSPDNLTGWFNVWVSLENETDFFHGQWHSFCLGEQCREEQAEIYFAWKMPYQEEGRDGDNWTGLLGLKGQVATHLNETQNGTVEFYVYNETWDQVYYDYFDFSIDDENPMDFDWNWSTTAMGNYSLQVYIYNATGDQIHYQAHDYCLGGGCYRPPAWFDWKEAYSQDDEEDFPGDDTLIIRGEIVTDSNESISGWLEFVVWGPFEGNFTDSYHFEVDRNDTYYFDWDYTAGEPGRYKVYVTIWNEDQNEIWHQQWHDFDLGMVCPGCFNIASAVMDKDDEGVANDALFFAHSGQEGLPGHLIEVYYASNDTLVGSDYTDGEGEWWLKNVSAGQYYWLAYDLQGHLLVNEGGQFRIGKEDNFQLKFFGFAGDMDGSGFDNDFMAGATDLSGQNRTLYVQIFDNLTGTLVAEGTMQKNDFGGDGPDTDTLFLASNLSYGLYDYIIWDSTDQEYWVQTGLFDICNPYGCLNLDIWVGDFEGDGNFDDAMVIAEKQNHWLLDNLTIHLFDDTGSEVASLTLGDGKPIFLNLTDGVYSWNVTAPTGDELDEGGVFLVDAEREYDHVALLADATEEPDSYPDDFVFSLNVTGRAVTDAYAEIYDWNGSLVSSGYTTEEHELRYWFVAWNLTPGRYLFSAWRNDTQEETLQNSTFVICPPPPKANVTWTAWFEEWDYQHRDEDKDGYNETKAIWYDLATDANETVRVVVYIEVNSDEGDYWNFTHEIWLSNSTTDWFNFTASYSDYYSFNITLYDEQGTKLDWFDIEDNWLEVNETNQPPTAFIDSLNPNPADEGESVTFRGHGTDDDGTIDDYEWTIDGWFASDQATFSLDNLTEGTYQVSLAVMDDEGAWSETVTTSLEIVLPENEPPEAEIEAVTPSPALVDETVTLEGTGTDPDGTIVLYEWDFDGDGTYDYNSTSSANTTTSYGAPGTYTITLRVTDNDGATDTDTFELEVREPQQNEPPTAAITSVSPSPAVVNATVTLNGTGTDPDGTIDLYEWDFDSDGVYDYTSPSSAATTTTYSSAGTYTITLRVTDNEGATDTASATLEVRPPGANQPPTASIDSLSPNPASEGATVTFDGSGSDNDGNIVGYQWYIDGQLASTSQSFTRDDLVLGDHDISFRVRDDDDEWSDNDTATLTIRDTTPPEIGLLVEPNYETGKLMIYVRANEDLVGLNVSLDNGSSRAVTYIVMTPDSAGDRRNYTGSHDSTAPGEYTVTASGSDDAGNSASTTTTATIEAVQTTPGQPTIIDNTDNSGTILNLFTNNGSSGSVSVSRTTAPAPTEAEAGLAELGIYVSIDIEDSLLADLDYVNITVYYLEAEIPAGVNEAGLVLYHYNEATDTWEKANPTGVNVIENYVWGHVSTFSVFAIFGANVAPNAEAGDPISAMVGEPVTFSATGSNDLDGTIVKYEWDFDGDGVYDYSSDTSTTANHTYQAEGTYKAKLKVTDDEGATGFDDVTVTVGKQDKEEKGGILPGFETAVALFTVSFLALALRRRRQ